MAREIKPYEELELKDDFMFGLIMHDPKYVKPFLEMILKIKIRKVVYPQSQKSIDLSANAKAVRLDVYVEDDQNTVFNLEMQTSDNRNLPKRMRYYQGVIDLNILQKGQDYTKLKKSYVIFICTFDPFGEGRHIYTFCNTCQENTALTLDDDAVKIILSTKGTMDDVSPEMKRILDYIDGKGASADHSFRRPEGTLPSGWLSDRAGRPGHQPPAVAIRHAGGADDAQALYRIGHRLRAGLDGQHD